MRGGVSLVLAILLGPLAAGAPILTDTPATLLISAPAFALAGAHAPLIGTLKQNGVGIPGQTVDFWLDGAPVGSTTTGTSGAFVFDVPIPARRTSFDLHATWLTGLPAQERSATLRVNAADPPGAPRNLTAIETAAQQASLAWDAPIDNGGAPLAGYSISRQGSDGIWQLVREQGVTPRAWTDPAPAGERYTYRVQARNAVATGTASEEASVVLRPPAPAAPTFEPRPDGTFVVRWSAPAGSEPLTGYTLYRGGAPILTTPPGTTSAVEGPFPPSTQHAYAVAASNAAGEGASSAASTLTLAPGAPTALVATATPNATQIVLTWSAPAEQGPAPATAYTVRRLANGSTRTFPVTSGFTLTDDDVAWGATYTYEVRAHNAGGAGPNASAVVVASPLVPILTTYIPQMLACVDGEAECVISPRDRTIRYHADEISFGPRAQGDLRDQEGTPMPGYGIYLVATVSWDGVVRGSASKWTPTLNEALYDAFVSPAGGWSDLPYAVGSCRDVTLSITATHANVSASDSYTWPVCHDYGL